MGTVHLLWMSIEELQFTRNFADCRRTSHIYTGWWYTPLKNIKVSWDDSSQYMEKWKMIQTTNQILYIYI